MTMSLRSNRTSGKALRKLVHAVLGERGDEPVEVAAILRLRVRDPETPDLRIELGRDVPRETLADRRRSFDHRMTVPRTPQPSLASWQRGYSGDDVTGTLRRIFLWM